MSKTLYHKIIFSSDNFEDIKNINSFNFSVIKEDNKVTIKINQTYSTNVFYYKCYNRYWVSFDEQTLADYLIHHNLIKGITNEKYVESNKITSIKFYNKYVELTCEDNFFESIELYKDHFDFKYVNDEILTIPIRDCGYIIKDWLKKYSNYINSINSEDLLIELSGGLDTRTLTYFWRNLEHKYYIYTKNDPKEINYAINVINQLPYKEYTFDKTSPLKNNKIILSGQANIHASEYTTSYDFKNFIGNRRIGRIINDIVPFYDKEYLKIKGDYVTQLKVTMNYMLCQQNNLYLLPYRTFKKKLFNFTNDIINECKEIIKCWDINI